MRASLRGPHRAARWSAHCAGSPTRATALMAGRFWSSSWTAATDISPRYTTMTGCGRRGFWMRTPAARTDDPEAEPRARHTVPRVGDVSAHRDGRSVPRPRMKLRAIACVIDDDIIDHVRR